MCTIGRIVKFSSLGSFFTATELQGMSAETKQFVQSTEIHAKIVALECGFALFKVTQLSACLFMTVSECRGQMTVVHYWSKEMQLKDNN